MILDKVVLSLQKEYSRLQQEMGKVGKALDALGYASGKKLKKTGRTLSEDPKGQCQASEVVVVVMLSQAPQPASFVASNLRTRP